jgi:hypothetical protein
MADIAAILADTGHFAVTGTVGFRCISGGL